MTTYPVKYITYKEHCEQCEANGDKDIIPEYIWIYLKNEANAKTPPQRDWVCEAWDRSTVRWRQDSLTSAESRIVFWEWGLDRNLSQIRAYKEES